ncbi:MetS family NSS transporter small subunit [candidate division KSB1 bacterium]
MNGSAILMLILVGAIVWGGFLVALSVALKQEKSK